MKRQKNQDTELEANIRRRNYLEETKINLKEVKSERNKKTNDGRN